MNRQAIEVLFSEEELAQAKAICEEIPLPNKKLTEAIVGPAMPRINNLTGQENNDRYFAYALEAYCKNLLP